MVELNIADEFKYVVLLQRFLFFLNNIDNIREGRCWVPSNSSKNYLLDDHWSSVT